MSASNDVSRVAIIAVHGVADQVPKETARSVAALLHRVELNGAVPVSYSAFAEVEVTGGAASSAARGEAPDILIRLDSQSWQVNGVSTDPEQGMTELKRLQEVGAEKAVLLVREELSSQDLVGALERIRRETSLSVTVAR